MKNYFQHHIHEQIFNILPINIHLIFLQLNLNSILFNYWIDFSWIEIQQLDLDLIELDSNLIEHQILEFNSNTLNGLNFISIQVLYNLIEYFHLNKT